MDMVYQFERDFGVPSLIARCGEASTKPSWQFSDRTRQTGGGNSVAKTAYALLIEAPAFDALIPVLVNMLVARAGSGHVCR